MARIGLVAGEGKLPIVFAKIAKAKGDTVIAFGLKGTASVELGDHVEKVHWIEWGALQKALLLLATERIKKLILLGKLKKEMVFKNEDKLDAEAKKMLAKIKDKKDYALLNEAANILRNIGIEIIDPTEYLKDIIPLKGTLTKKEPTKDEWQDISYGRDVAKELSRHDIGQTVIVKDKTVIALEAAEGTDETIRRAGSLTGGGFVVVKVARPDQDMRFDVPLAGLATLNALIEAKGRVLAVEEKKTFLLDKDELIKRAEERDISVVVI